MSYIPFFVVGWGNLLIWNSCSGVKWSGFGREGSKYGIEEYQTIKTVTLGGMGQDLEGS